MTRRFRPIGSGKRSTADAVEAAAERSEKSGRVVSIAEFSRVTGFDRGTLRSWIDRGCPTESSPTAKGEAILVDIRAVWKWREEQVARETSSRFATPDGDELGGEPMKPADLLKLEQIKQTRLKIGREAELLVPRIAVEYMIERMLGLIRQAVFGLGDGIIRDFPHLDDAERRRMLTKIKTSSVAALKEGAKSVSEFFDDEAFEEDMKRELGL
ncbi:hypothetical protein H9Q09_11980 [Aurantimonas sp. DM33-3]|uniref:hypothetical protein n=1 Tax=Aurantimonas sp. DM33-3 TaxID=2766955 RepID=UPI00165214F0|nr:hypothetical protein [Aurantimonas sp. DM33-3]MBC6716927.1 hypothetical protein [Aurantimonas sp. DM33-3]